MESQGAGERCHHSRWPRGRGLVDGDRWGGGNAELSCWDAYGLEPFARCLSTGAFGFSEMLGECKKIKGSSVSMPSCTFSMAPHPKGCSLHFRHILHLCLHIVTLLFYVLDPFRMPSNALGRVTQTNSRACRVHGVAHMLKLRQVNPDSVKMEFSLWTWPLTQEGKWNRTLQRRISADKSKILESSIPVPCPFPARSSHLSQYNEFKGFSFFFNPLWQWRILFVEPSGRTGQSLRMYPTFAEDSHGASKRPKAPVCFSRLFFFFVFTPPSCPDFNCSMLMVLVPALTSVTWTVKCVQLCCGHIGKVNRNRTAENRGKAYGRSGWVRNRAACC